MILKNYCFPLEKLSVISFLLPFNFKILKFPKDMYRFKEFSYNLLRVSPRIFAILFMIFYDKICLFPQFLIFKYKIKSMSSIYCITTIVIDSKKYLEIPPYVCKEKI